MSYTVEIICQPVSPDDDSVLQYLDRVEEEDSYADPSADVLRLYERVVAQFPCICEDPDGPWADGPLINNFKSPVTILGISFSRVEEVLPSLVSTVNSAGFTLYDPQDDVIYRPNGTASHIKRQQEQTKTKKPWWRPW